MQNKILKKMMCYEADLQEIRNFLQILYNCVENNNDCYYLQQFVKIIETKLDSFAENYEELNNQVWVLLS
ncbi:MAG TPA: hypothetical protein IAD11_07805 [Candidatus Stercorousia faecigallinarum]|nr:hypothetical protein [Candidatus Stercorousia faecigallinarum]